MNQAEPTAPKDPTIADPAAADAGASPDASAAGAGQSDGPRAATDGGENDIGGGPAGVRRTGSVRVFERGGKTYHIIGTAHVSARSVEEVQRVIQELRPDTVCVELDETRYKALVDDSSWRKLDIFQVIRQKKLLFLMASLGLAAFQRRLGDAFGVKPGAELLAGAQAAEAVGAELVLADRDVRITLKRTWEAIPWGRRLQIARQLLGEVFEEEELTEDQIEALKDGDTINEMLQEFATRVPEIKTPLIDERDLYLMSSILEAPGKVVVGVVGAAHVSGMLEHVNTPVDRDALNEMPRPHWSSGMWKWVIPAIVVAAFGFGIWKHQGEGIESMLWAWVLPNMVFAGLFATVALAHPFSILAAMLASPITSLNPTLQAGMFAGLTEAWLRKPTVEDCEKVPEAMGSMGGMYKNRFTRSLLVALLTSAGSAVGAWIGLGWLIRLLF